MSERSGALTCPSDGKGPRKMSANCKRTVAVYIACCVFYAFSFFMATAFCVTGRSGDISWVSAACPYLLLILVFALAALEAIDNEKRTRAVNLQNELYEQRIEQLEAELASERHRCVIAEQRMRLASDDAHDPDIAPAA